MTPFIYDDDIPDALLPEIQKALEPWAWMVPRWCDNVYVGYSDLPDDGLLEGTAATCEIAYPYRWARITFKPCFLVQSDVPHDGLHEVMHIPVSVLSDWVREKIKILVPETEHPKFRESLIAELTERVESVVEDITSRIHEHANQLLPVTLHADELGKLP